MKNKIQIVNWLLTRKCNLRCEYCRIVKNYKNKPIEYPDIKYYIENEMSTEMVIEGLRKLKLHNPDCFHIFYGGEPFLREDLHEIINYCNENKIHYTIISNNTDKVKPLLENLMEKTGKIEGFSASIDPIIYKDGNSDIYKKSINGFIQLQRYSKVIKDTVAEITVTNENLDYLYLLVRDLTDKGISSSITFIDISKNPYYDFSNIEDDSLLVRKTSNLKDIINRIIDEKLNVHMRDILLPIIYDNLPSEYDCKLEDNFHNMTVDADGSVRLCLRCRGIATPSIFNISNILDEKGNLNSYILNSISYDKSKYCSFCNWSCTMMSKILSEGQDEVKNLIHLDIRNK